MPIGHPRTIHIEETSADDRWSSLQSHIKILPILWDVWGTSMISRHIQHMKVEHHLILRNGQDRSLQTLVETIFLYTKIPN